MTMTKHKYTPKVIQAARTAAVAMAAFWDAMRDYEYQTGKSFDGTIAAIESLASECDIDADVNNTARAGLTDRIIRSVLNHHLTVDGRY